MNKNRIWLMIVGMALILCFALPAMAATQTGTAGDATWSLDTSTGVMTVTGSGELDLSDSSIPHDGVKQIKVSGSFTSIEKGGLGNFHEATSITLPGTLKEIGYGGISYCESLTSIVLPDKLESIGEQAFFNCGSLKTITLPASLKSMDIIQYVFYSCDQLTDINVESGNTNFSSKNGALYNADGTELLLCPDGKQGTFTVAEGTVRIPDGALMCGRNLTSIVLPASVTYIEGFPLHDLPDGEGINNFAYCANLVSIEVDADNPTYVSVDGALYLRQGMKFLRCPPGKTGAFRIDSRSSAIGENAFWMCQELVSISIPDTVTEIGGEAFSACWSLQSVTLPKKLTQIDSGMFRGCSELKNITIPNGVTEISTAAFEGTGLTSIVIPDSVKILQDYAFCRCYDLKKVTIPASVTTIYGDDLFSECGDVDFWVVRDSYAHQYLKKHGFKCKLIGEDKDQVSLSDCKVASVKDQTYTGKALKPAVKVTYGGKTLALGTDYTVTYKNNKNVGKASIVITGKGNYTGTRTVTFKINPKGTRLSKLTKGKKTFTATWKKQAVQTTGYQLQYALKKSFKGAKTVTLSKVKTVKKPIAKLKARTTYYVRVRTFKKVGGVKYYSAWSKVKSVKTK